MPAVIIKAKFSK